MRKQCSHQILDAQNANDVVYGFLIYRDAAMSVRRKLMGSFLQGRIHDLGRELCVVAGDEEEIWIGNYPQTVTVFKPMKPE